MSGTYGSTTTTLSSAIATKHLRELIDIAEGRLIASKFASNQPMKRGEGGTLVYNRLLRPTLCTAAATSGTLIHGGGTTVKSLTSSKVSVTPSIFQDSFAIDDDVEIEAFITDEAQKKTIANQMAISLDYQVMKMLATQGLRHRIDKDASYQSEGIVTTGTSTTETRSATLAATYANDLFDVARMVVYSPSGMNYDHPARLCSNYVQSNGVVTHAAFPAACTVGTYFRITTGTGIAATDVLTTAGLLDVQAIHDKLETQLFDDGYLRGFFDSAQYRDLWNDTVFVASGEYDMSEIWKGYRLARWAGVELLISSNVYREDVDATEFGHGAAGTTGVVYVSPIFGQNAYALTPWGNGSGKFAVNWFPIDGPDSYNLTMNQKFLSWKTFWGGTVLRSTSVVDLMTGATSLSLAGL